MNLVQFPHAQLRDPEQHLANARIPRVLHDIGAAVLHAVHSPVYAARFAGEQVYGLLTAVGEVLGEDMAFVDSMRGADTAAVHHPDIPRYSLTRRLNDEVGRGLGNRLHSANVCSRGLMAHTVSMAFYDRSAPSTDVRVPKLYSIDLFANMEHGAPFDRIYTTITLTSAPKHWAMTLGKGVETVGTGPAPAPDQNSSYRVLAHWRQALLHDVVLGVPRSREG